MDQLRNYVAPLVALVLMLLWFFVLRPRLEAGEAASDEQSEDASE